MPITDNPNRAGLYQSMFNRMEIPALYQTVLIALAKRAVQFKATYQKIESTINIPWWMVAAIHYRESNFSLVSHLHNGDSLTRRTVHEPKGRPLKGTPPFTWLDSAIDALLYDNLENTDQLSTGEQLELLEQYNGIGYYKYHNMNSPYLWNYSQFYERGKYVSDGSFDPNFKDKQAGAAPLIAAIIEVNAGWI